MERMKGWRAPDCNESRFRMGGTGSSAGTARLRSLFRYSNLAAARASFEMSVQVSVVLRPARSWLDRPSNLGDWRERRDDGRGATPGWEANGVGVKGGEVRVGGAGIVARGLSCHVQV